MKEQRTNAGKVARQIERTTQKARDSGRLMDSDFEFYCSFYKTLSEYEHHFDSMELEVRKIASYWLGVIFAAIAFIVRGSLHADVSLASASTLLCLIALLGNTGMFALWSIDQRVYHALLNAVFRIGLTLEHRYPQIPPIRAQMWRNSENCGMGRYQVLFYVLPMGLIALVGLFGVARATGTLGARVELFLIALTAILIPLWIARSWLSELLVVLRVPGWVSTIAETELGDRDLSAESRAILDRWETNKAEKLRHARSKLLADVS